MLTVWLLELPFWESMVDDLVVGANHLVVGIVCLMASVGSLVARALV